MAVEQTIKATHAGNKAPDPFYFEIIERIKKVTHARTQIELANILNIRQSSVSDAKRRQSIPAEWYLKLFEILGANPDWLKRGIGPIYLRTETGYFPSNEDRIITNLNLLTEPLPCAEIVTVYSIHGDYTEKSYSFIEHNIIEKIAIPKHYACDGLVVFLIDNDSASPTVRRNSYVGINTLSTYPISGEFFAVNMPYEGIVLRKLFWKQEKNCFVLKSENAEFPEIHIDVEQRKYILGKLSWILQKV